MRLCSTRLLKCLRDIVIHIRFGLSSLPLASGGRDTEGMVTKERWSAAEL